MRISWLYVGWLCCVYVVWSPNFSSPEVLVVCFGFSAIVHLTVIWYKTSLFLFLILRKPDYEYQVWRDFFLAFHDLTTILEILTSFGLYDVTIISSSFSPLLLWMCLRNPLSYHLRIAIPLAFYTCCSLILYHLCSFFQSKLQTFIRTADFQIRSPSSRYCPCRKLLAVSPHIPPAPSTRYVPS